MKRPFGALVLLLGLAGLAGAQPNLREARIFTNPAPPSREILDPLNLRLAWKANVPVDDKRDGLLTVQFAPYVRGKQAGFHLLVQTRGSMVVCLDGDTGREVWRTLIGRPFEGDQPLAFNNTTVMVVRGTDIFGLDRDTGELRWRFKVPSPLETAPIADSENLYLTQAVGNRITTYRLPSRDEKEPRFDWDYTAFIPLDLPPKLTENFLCLPSSRGSVQVMFKAVSRPLLRYKTDGLLRAGIGAHEKDGFIYIGSSDANVYAEKVEGEVQQRSWRFTAGTPITRAPVVNDQDVYVTAEDNGVFRVLRLDLTPAGMGELLVRRGYMTQQQFQTVLGELGPRANDTRAVLDAVQRKNFLTARQRNTLVWQGGEPLWRNRQAERVLAVNPKFVYALDASSRLLVLSRETGRMLSGWCEARDFPFSIVNEASDRLFLGAHNGLIICLHDRDYPAPLVMKSLLPIVPPPAKPQPGGGVGALGGPGR